MKLMVRLCKASINLGKSFINNHMQILSNLGSSSDFPHRSSYLYTYTYSNKTRIRDKVREKYVNTTKVYNEIYR